MRADGDKRLDGDNPFEHTLFIDRNWHIVDVLKRVAHEVGESAARIALAWVFGRLGVASTFMGVSRSEQVGDNVGWRRQAAGLRASSTACSNRPSATKSSSAARTCELEILLTGRREALFNAGSCLTRPSPRFGFGACS